MWYGHVNRRRAPGAFGDLRAAVAAHVEQHADATVRAADDDDRCAHHVGGQEVARLGDGRARGDEERRAERGAQLGRGDGGVGVVRVRNLHDRRREITLPGDGGGVDSRDALCGGRGDGLGVEVHGLIIHKAP